MKPALIDTLARLRVCSAAAIAPPRDLVEAAIECLEDIAGAELLRARRDVLLRLAALFMPSTPPWAAAQVMANERARMMRTWHLQRAQEPALAPVTPREFLHAAALLYPLPKSARQFYRVIAPTDTDRGVHVSSTEAIVSAPQRMDTQADDITPPRSRRQQQ